MRFIIKSNVSILSVLFVILLLNTTSCRNIGKDVVSDIPYIAALDIMIFEDPSYKLIGTYPQNNSTCIKTIMSTMEKVTGVSLENAQEQDYVRVAEYFKNNSEDKTPVLYVNTLKISAFNKEKRRNDIISEIKRLRSSGYQLNIEYSKITDNDKETFLSNQTMSNLLGMFEYKAKLEMPKIDKSDNLHIAIGYLDDRDALLPLIDWDEFDDIDNELLLLIAEAIRDSSGPDRAKRVLAEWSDNTSRYFVIKGKRNHSIRYGFKRYCQMLWMRT